MNKMVVGGVSAMALLSVGYAGYWLGGQSSTVASQDVRMTDDISAEHSHAALENPDNWGVAEGETATKRHIQAHLKAGDVDPVTGRKILYYHDPMVPGKKFDAPAKSPFMDMMLVPKYEGSGQAEDAAGSVHINGQVQQNLAIRFGVVSEKPLRQQVTAVGQVEWDERRAVTIQARATGFVEQLFVRATLDPVKKGQPLFSVYVPDWVAAQEEYLALLAMSGPEALRLRQAAKQRMRLVGMDDAQIELVSKTKKVQLHALVVAPQDGVITELAAREGSTVLPGMLLAKLNQLSTVWVQADIPESQVAMVNALTQLMVTTSSLPNKVFSGKLQTLLPMVNTLTRTRKARMVIDNAGEQLVPGMFVQVALNTPETAHVLVVPTEAIIRTGQRNLVMAVNDDQSFSVQTVTLGAEVDQFTEIQSGLKLGQKIVTSGQFLIDSEASLSGVEARLDQQPSADPMDKVYRTEAKFESVDGDTVTLTHPAIPALKWPGMTMDFKLSPDIKLPSLQPEDQVVIDFKLQDGDDPMIVKLESK